MHWDSRLNLDGTKITRSTLAKCAVIKIKSNWIRLRRFLSLCTNCSFRHLLRYFNAGMAMGSIQVDDQTVYQGGQASFKVHGQIYKRIGPMLPSLPSVFGDGTPKCLQIWFCDTEEQANLRVQQNCIESAVRR